MMIRKRYNALIALHFKPFAIAGYSFPNPFANTFSLALSFYHKRPTLYSYVYVRLIAKLVGRTNIHLGVCIEHEMNKERVQPTIPFIRMKIEEGIVNNDPL